MNDIHNFVQLNENYELAFVHEPTWYSRPSGEKIVMCRSNPALEPRDILAAIAFYMHVQNSLQLQICLITEENMAFTRTAGNDT